MMDDSASKSGEGRSLHLQGASRQASGNHVERKPEEKANGCCCCLCCNSGPVLAFNASASGRKWCGEEADGRGGGRSNLAGDENEAEASSLWERPAEAVFGRGSD